MQRKLQLATTVSAPIQTPSDLLLKTNNKNTPSFFYKMKMYQFFFSLLLATLGSLTTVLSAASPDDLDLVVLYENGEPIGYKVDYTLNSVVGELVIPAEYPYGDEGETLPIIEIGEYAFEDGLELTSVTIPGTVKTIRGDAFSYCESLESATLLEGVPYVGEGMFSYTPLTSVSLPQSVDRIGEFAFNGCASLTSITIPSGVTHIDGYAFFRATALQNIYFEGPAPSIGVDAFTDIADDATFYVLAEHLASYEALNLGGVSLATYVPGEGGGGSGADNFYAVSGSYNAENGQFIIVSEGEDSAWNMEVQSTDDLTSGEWTTLSDLNYLEATNTEENTVTRTFSNVDTTEAPTRYYRLHSDSNTE